MWWYIKQFGKDVPESRCTMGNAVNKGFEFEVYVEKFLNDCGLRAGRTNKANDHDPENYKRGFDGGVDIIASYATEPKYNKGYTFYIQCKCYKKDLTKTAIAEVYAGINVRNVKGWNCLPVVIASCDASQETIQYAKDLDVELILRKDWDLLHAARVTGKAPYGNYGVLMKILLHHYTGDDVYVQTLPDSFSKNRELTMTEKLMEQFKKEFDSAQSHLDRAQVFERKRNEEHQKALDIQKTSVFKALQFADRESKTSKPDDDSG